MPKMIDPAKVEAAIAGMHQYLTPLSDNPGQEGTTARAMLAILPATARWSTTEFTRDTPAEETFEALAVAMSNALASELDGIDAGLDEKIGHLNRFLRYVAEGVFEIISKLDDAKLSALIPAEECGNA